MDGIEIGTSSLIEDFLNKRLRFIEKDEDAPGNTDQFLREFRSILTKLTDARDMLSVIDLLDQWSNHSFRHVAFDVAELARRFMLNSDSAYPATILKATTPGNLRHIRSCVYKYMITGPEELAYKPDVGIPNVYSRQDGTDLVPYPLLAMLLLLSSDYERRTGGNRVAALMKSINTLGIDEDISRYLLNVLAGGAPGDDDASSDLRSDHESNLFGFGFIFVQTASRRLYEETRGSTLIELQPRGRFLIRTLALSNEYLFWMSDVMRSGTSAPYGRVGSESIRLEVATRFVESEVWPRLRDAAEHASADRSADLTFRRIFPRGVGEFGHAVVGSLDGFAAQVQRDTESSRANARNQLPSTAVRRLEQQIDRIRAAREKLGTMDKEMTRWLR